MEHYPCNPETECRLRELGECKEDIHHRYFPKRRYQGSVARAFRELDENKELTCRARHNEIHATQKPPEKPRNSEMIVAIQNSMGAVAVGATA